MNLLKFYKKLFEGQHSSVGARTHLDLHTQHAFCLGIMLAGGDYVLFAKGNQPTLHEDLRLFFEEPPIDCQDWRTAQTCDCAHGRLELRDLIASTELNDFLSRPWIR